ncbi:MAG: replication protein RepA [Promethearchaeota archaeon]
MSDVIKRQAPARIRSINEITDDDFRVRVIGTVVSIAPNERILDDGTGTINVVTDQNLEVGAFIRVIGRIFRKDDGTFELNAEIIQDMKELDTGLYNKVRELQKKYSS